MPDEAAPQPSPLLEATPDSLERIFNIDPLNLQDQDIDQTVLALRKQRHNFLATGGETPKKRAAKQKLDPATLASLDLSKLDL